MGTVWPGSKWWTPLKNACYSPSVLQFGRLIGTQWWQGTQLVFSSLGSSQLEHGHFPSAKMSYTAGEISMLIHQVPTRRSGCFPIGGLDARAVRTARACRRTGLDAFRRNQQHEDHFRQITPGTTLKPKSILWDWQIASGTVFVISATRPRREWFPSRTMCHQCTVCHPLPNCF